MAESLNNIFDGVPPVGDQSRTVKLHGRVGCLVPYISFDPEYGAELLDAVRRSKTTGVIPMGLILPGIPSAIASSMHTHDTPYTQALGIVRDRETKGYMPTGSTLAMTIEIMSGTFDPGQYGFELDC